MLKYKQTADNILLFFLKSLEQQPLLIIALACKCFQVAFS